MRATVLLVALLALLGCAGDSGDLAVEVGAGSVEVCPDCPDCAPDGSCPQSFCEARSCIAGKCRAETRDCNDGLGETWDRCDGREQRCHHYLGDGIKACAADGDCATGHPCQQFTCVEGLCRVTEKSLRCGSVFLRPVVCQAGAVRDHCDETMRWRFSYPEKSLVLLSGGPRCEGRPGEHFFCEWGTEAAIPEKQTTLGNDGGGG